MKENKGLSMFTELGISSNGNDISLSDQSAGNRDLLTTTSNEDSSPSDKTGSHKDKNSMSSSRCFGVELTPDNIAVAMVYFVQGVLGLSDLAVGFYLKDDLHLDPAEVCHFPGENFFTLLVEIPQTCILSESAYLSWKTNYIVLKFYMDSESKIH